MRHEQKEAINDGKAVRGRDGSKLPDGAELVGRGPSAGSEKAAVASRGVLGRSCIGIEDGASKAGTEASQSKEMIIDVESLGSLPLSERRSLPDEPGVYFALGLGGKVLYIGQAKSIRQRWEAHHCAADLGDTRKVRIAWLPLFDPDERRKLEKRLIGDFKPVLNRSYIPKSKALVHASPRVTGNELKDKRNALGLTQAQLAKILEVKPNTVARWEQGVLAVPKVVELALPTIERNAKNKSKTK